MIKKKIKNIIQTIAAPAFKNELNSTEYIAKAYQQMIEANQQKDIGFDLLCEGIVFSKDRAMQLHALLSSYFFYVKNPVRLNILYKTSNERHDRSYEELKIIFREKQLVFINETIFKEDLENLLNEINATKVFFMTDDGLFIDQFDIKEIARFDPVCTVATLIKGIDLTYCYVQNKKQKLPEFINPSTLALPGYMKCWEWGKAESWSDWAYPLSLDTSFYNKKEIQMLTKNLSYKGPNSLEISLHNAYGPIFLQRKGVCYDKAKYVNIVCNVVNTEHKNRNTGLHSVESLLKKWNEGYRIKFEEFFGRKCTDAEKSSFTFIKR